MRIDALSSISMLSGGKQPGVKSVARAERNEKDGGEKPMPPKLSRDERINVVKNRIQSGYYGSTTVSEAISDRLTGVFDQLA